MEKVIKFAVSVFFLSCVFVSFLTGLPKLEISAEAFSHDSAQTEALMQKQFEKLSQTKMEQLVRNILEKKEITPEKITTDLHILLDNSISITKITVWLRDVDEEMANSAEELVRKETGIETQIKIVKSR